MMQFILDRKFVFFLIPFLILYIVAARHPLMWDTIQFAADQPSWYYNNNFRYFMLPDYCDSGHPPTFGIYLAAMWKLFGKSLWVSHTAMLPFIFMIVYQAVKLGDRIFPDNKKHAFYCTLLLLSEAVLISQSSLVSPDILVVAFFLYALNAVLSRSVLHTTLAASLLGLLSMRAMVASMALFIFALSYNAAQVTRDKKNIFLYGFQQVLPFVPGGIIAIVYFIYHYSVKGWIGMNPTGPWSGAYGHWNGISSFLRNLLVLGWRLVDIGKIGMVLVFALMLLLWMTGRLRFETVQRKKMAQNLLVLFLAVFLFAAMPLCLSDSLLQHRYFMPFTLSVSLLAIYLLLGSNLKMKNGIVAVMVLVQLSGHFWNYPRRFSQGWDSTLAHIPFFSLRAEFKQFMEEHEIPKTEVATAFSLIKPDSDIDLKGDTTSYKDVHTDSTQYIWYSNVSNTMNKTVDYYFKNWQVIKYEKKGNVEMALFKRK